VNTRGAAMEKELERREKELTAEKRKAAAAANENALLRERLSPWKLRESVGQIQHLQPLSQPFCLPH
jgi:hypothetical protein